MRYKAVFIDIDDTLLDYVPCCREAFDAAMDDLKNRKYEPELQRSKEDLFELFFAISGRLFSEAKHGKHTIAEVMELYPAEFISRAGYPDNAVEPFKLAFRKAWGETHILVPDAKEVLQKLRQKGYKLYAASNSFGHLQRRRLERAGILHLFEETFISMDIGYDKPDKRFFDFALKRVNELADGKIQAGEVLMVGDSMTTDILGAQRAGWNTCFFVRRKDEPVPEEYNGMVIRELKELETNLEE